MNAVIARRSIRKYTQEAVSENDIKDLLKAAMSAPSAGNQQPWHFIVINDRSILDEIPKFHPYSHMLKQANTAILVCGDTEHTVHKDYWVQDCSAATENILIEAQSKGLGAVWLGVYPNEERYSAMQKLLNLPSSIIPLSLIPVGYPAEQKPPADRYDTNRIHYNMW